MADRSSTAKQPPSPPPVRQRLASEIRERPASALTSHAPLASKPRPPAKPITQPVAKAPPVVHTPVAKAPPVVHAPVAKAQPVPKAPAIAQAPPAAKPPAMPPITPARAEPAAALAPAPVVVERPVERVKALPPPLPVEEIVTGRLTPPPLPVFPPAVLAPNARPAWRDTVAAEEIPDFLNGSVRRRRVGWILLLVAGLGLATVFIAAFLSQMQPR